MAIRFEGHIERNPGMNGIPVRITPRRLNTNFPRTFNAQNPNNLTPIKRQESIYGHGPIALNRTLPNIMVLNARSIFNKLDELKVHIVNYKIYCL